MTSYAVGDRVFGFVDGRPGAHAELVAVAVDGLVARVPEGWDLAEAAPGMEAAHYAHAFLRVTGLGPGDRALVHGATGGIGTAAVQLLRAEGVEVTAVCDRLPPGRPELLSELGAARVVELAGDAGWRRSEGLRRGPRRDRAHLVRRHAPAAPTRRQLRLVGPGPRGAEHPARRSRAGGSGARSPPRAVPVAPRRRRLAAYLRQLMDRGAYRPVVDRTYDFDELREAYAYVDTGRKVGNVVVIMPGPGWTESA